MVDLTAVRRRVIQETGWSDHFAQAVEKEYLAFLLADKETEPTSLVEVYWHMHILDTQSYREDCQELRGGFIDHIPGSQPGRCRKHIMVVN